MNLIPYTEIELPSWYAVGHWQRIQYDNLIAVGFNVLFAIFRHVGIFLGLPLVDLYYNPAREKKA